MQPCYDQADMAEGSTSAMVPATHHSVGIPSPLTVALPPAQNIAAASGSSAVASAPGAPPSPLGAACSAGLAIAGTTMMPVYGEGMDDIPPPKADFSAPPPYELATKLPTYEEVQREKSLQGEIPRVAPPLPRTSMSMFLAIDTDPNPDDTDTSLLGTDFMFFTAFIVAFLFNWIGFLLLLCFCHTIAARYGALAGFGLSLAKWTLIVKHSTDLLASRENNWLWWLLMTLGLLICVRAIIQYLNIKRGWRLLSGHAQERLMFFY